MLHRLWIVLLLVLLLLPVLLPPTALAQDEPVRIIFMHHSTGLGLIEQGEVRAAFTDLGYEFWDHGYNDEGLVDAEGNWLGVNWEVPDDNTDPDGWERIFNQPVTDPPANTFSHMLEYDVIIFKSCFPNADIQTEEQFETYQSYFSSIRDVIAQHPDKLFIALTIPPLTPNSTSPEAVARARRWAEYLISPEFLEGYPNLVVFDFYTLLADEDGYLRADYRPDDEYDSHPNERANQTVGPLFVDFVDQAIQAFIPGSVPRIDEAEAAVEMSRIEDFETVDFPNVWWTYVIEESSLFDCQLSDSGFESDHALQMTFDIQAGGGAGCGGEVVPTSAWADASGITFQLRADTPDVVVRVALGLADDSNPDAVPFEVELRTEGEDWSTVTLWWNQFYKPDWVGAEGVDEFDPSKAVWISVNVGYWEAAQKGAVWIDNFNLVE